MTTINEGETMDMDYRQTQAWLTIAREPGDSRIRMQMEAAEVQAVIDKGAEKGIRFITPQDDEWPAGLADLHLPPAGLWVKGGDLSPLTRSLGIVGARAATSYGEHVAMELAEDFAHNGYAVVSGGAYGIDGAAHRAAIAVGGKTFAFLAGGVDRMYPAGHLGLAERLLASGGALISEMPPGSSPTKWRFLARNRLIAAASQATLVVEAGARSGSLNTVGHARAIGRPVFAVPGPVTSAASVGTNELIRDRLARAAMQAADVTINLG